MCLNEIMLFLDNSTVASIFSLAFGFFAAVKVYRWQKDIDRRYEAESQLLENVLVLKERCKAVNQHIDRLVNTLNEITKSGDEEALKVFAEKSLPMEIDQAARILMYVIPEVVAKVESSMLFYFDKDAEIGSATQAVLNSFKSWHDLTQNYLIGKTGSFDPHKRVADVPELSLAELDKRIIELGALISKRP